MAKIEVRKLCEVQVDLSAIPKQLFGKCTNSKGVSYCKISYDLCHYSDFRLHVLPTRDQRGFLRRSTSGLLESQPDTEELVEQIEFGLRGEVTTTRRSLLSYPRFGWN